jgi:hypothetical protein
MTSIWNFLRYVSIGINGTKNIDQRNGKDLDRIEDTVKIVPLTLA